MKRFISILLTLVVCFIFSSSAFAESAPLTPTTSATNKPYETTFKVSSNGITPLSSLGGYGNATISTSGTGLIINCNGSGLGGMGITITTNCSYGNYVVEYGGAPLDGAGLANKISGTMSTNDTVTYNNLWHMDLGKYYIGFSFDENTPDFYVQVWIYG